MAKFRADRFAKLMKEKGFTDGKLAYASGVSRSMIYYMRTGQRETPSGEKVAAVAEPLKTSPQYLMDETDDSSPVQKTMSAIAADIVDMIDRLPPSQQRIYQELGKALLRIEERMDVEAIYDELIERITRLAELDGGERVLDRLIDRLNSVSDRSVDPPPPSVPRDGGRVRAKGESDSAQEPSQGHT